MRNVLVRLAVLAAVLAGVTVAQEGKRVALIIGNDAYSIRPLKNAVNDARAMQKALAGAGFQTILRENATKLAMEKAVVEFFREIAPGSIALFYYAGHAVQIENENLLIPVDFASSKDLIEAKYRSFSLTQVFEYLRRQRAKANIVILDACRSNPVVEENSLPAGLTIPSNLGKDTYIAFSTSPNHVATDNPDGNNSWFTEALADFIAQPDLTLDDVMTRVRLRVQSATGGAQTPWSQTSLTAKFYFHPPMNQAAETDASAVEKWYADALKQEQYGNWAEEFELLNRILKQKPGAAVEASVQARLPYVSARNEAQTHFDAGEYQAAYDAYEKALAAEPFDTDSAMEAASTALLFEDLPRAINALQAVRQRGTSTAVSKADSILKELAAIEPSAKQVLERPLPQPPAMKEIFKAHQFGVPDWQAGRRIARQGTPVDYAAIAKQLPPPPEIPRPAENPAVPATESAQQSETQGVGEPAVSLADLHVSVESIAGSRDLSVEDFGEINIVSDKPALAVVLDGRLKAKTLPYNLKVPAGKYAVKTIEAGRTLFEQQVEVKPGALVNLVLK